jgi:hypothetical protein
MGAVFQHLSHLPQMPHTSWWVARVLFFAYEWSRKYLYRLVPKVLHMTHKPNATRRFELYLVCGNYFWYVWQAIIGIGWYCFFDRKNTKLNA